MYHYHQVVARAFFVHVFDNDMWVNQLLYLVDNGWNIKYSALVMGQFRFWNRNQNWQPLWGCLYGWWYFKDLCFTCQRECQYIDWLRQVRTWSFITFLHSALNSHTPDCRWRGESSSKTESFLYDVGVPKDPRNAFVRVFPSVPINVNRPRRYTFMSHVPSE